MVVSNSSDNNSKYVINPGDLKINNKSLINDKLASLLFSKNINIAMDVYDSDSIDKDKPTMVFIHGNSASKKVFYNQIEYFANKYRVIAFDLIGHGESTKISDFDTLTSHEMFQLSEIIYDPQTMIAGVKQLLEGKGIKQAHVVGWSLGGHIAYGLAVECPQIVSSVTTIGSPPIKLSSQGLVKGFNEWFFNSLVPEWVNHPKKYTLKEAEDIASCMGIKTEDKYFVEDMIDSDPQMRKYLFINLNQYDSHEFTATVLDGEHFVKNTELPVCLIVGENDSGINANYFQTFNGKLINQSSRVIIIKDAPHAVFNTHKDEFHKIMESFLK